MPPAPAGIDPRIWQANQALVLSLMPLFQQMVTPPAPAPPAPPAATRKEGTAKAPTPFSGEDHSKLRDFLFECGLNFDTRPITFATEKSRILFAVQHLEGMAKRHFRRHIEAGSTDPVVNSWAEFTRELRTVFGDPDHLGRASDKLLKLGMKENGHVHRYTVLFKEAADELGWPNDVLHRLYYGGLANRIKDLWERSEPPSDFEQLVQEAQRADTRYWKRVEEKKGESSNSRTSSNQSHSKPANSASNQSTSKSASHSATSTSSSSQNRSSSTSTSTTNNRSNTASTRDKSKDLSKVLGPDGKLLPEEKARREKLGLCFYCAEKHATDQCPKKAAKKDTTTSQPSTTPKTTTSTTSSSKPKGRIAQVVTPVAEESESEEPADTSDF